MPDLVLRVDVEASAEVTKAPTSTDDTNTEKE